MKVILKDKRSNPRITFIDGKRYILPSNKEVIKDISRNAFLYLSQCAWLEVRKYIEPKVVEQKPEETEPPISNIESNESAIENKESVKDAVENSVNENNTVTTNVVLVEEPEIREDVVDEKPTEDIHVEESVITPSNEEIVADSSVEEVNYSSMSKRELKSVIEKMGGDPSGMSKANMLDWLKNNKN